MIKSIVKLNQKVKLTTIDSASLPSRSFTFHQELWKSMRGADLMILGGGGPFSDPFPYRIPSLIYPLLIEKLLNKPVVMFSVGISIVPYRLGKLLLRLVCNQVDFITVRDNLSKRNLIRYGVWKEISLSADPDLVLIPCRVNVTVENQGFSKLTAWLKKCAPN